MPSPLSIAAERRAALARPNARSGAARGFANPSGTSRAEAGYTAAIRAQLVKAGIHYTGSAPAKGKLGAGTYVGTTVTKSNPLGLRRVSALPSATAHTTPHPATKVAAAGAHHTKAHKTPAAGTGSGQHAPSPKPATKPPASPGAHGGGGAGTGTTTGAVTQGGIAWGRIATVGVIAAIVVVSLVIYGKTRKRKGRR